MSKARLKEQFFQWKVIELDICIGSEVGVEKRVNVYWFNVIFWSFYPLNTWKLFEKFQKKKQRFKHLILIKLVEDS